MGLQHYGLWVLDNSADVIDPSAHIPAEVSLVIHPFYHERVFADPRFLWIPAGYSLGNIAAGRLSFPRASQRSMACYFKGSLGEGRSTFEKKIASVKQCTLAKTPTDVVNAQGDNQAAVAYMDASFVLCPRDADALESTRVYEALENGAIPVLVQADYDAGHYALTHPHNEFVVIPDWSHTAAMLGSWFDQPAGRAQLDRLQRRNIDWYHEFKAAVGHRARAFILQQAFNNSFAPLYCGLPSTPNELVNSVSLVTESTGPVINSNYSNVTVWIDKSVLWERRNWQALIHDLMGDLPVPVKVIVIFKEAKFADALHIPGFHIFAVVRASIPEVQM